MTDVFAIYGSPREKSFSTAIQRAFISPFEAEGLAVTELRICDEAFSSCTGCGKCAEEDCIFSDSVTKIYSDLMSCALLTVSAPVYFSGLPARLKALIDRCQYIWERREEPIAKKGFFISAAGSAYKTVFDGSMLTIKHFFNTLKADFNEKDFILLTETDRLKEISVDMLLHAERLGEKYCSAIRGAKEALA